MNLFLFIFKVCFCSLYMSNNCHFLGVGVVVVFLVCLLKLNLQKRLIQ